MTHFLKQSFILFLLSITVLLSAQNTDDDQPNLNTKLILGTGFYTLDGDEDSDIKEAETYSYSGSCKEVWPKI